MAVHAHGAARWRDEAGEDAHRRGFSGAVRAQKADDFPSLHFEIDLVERTERPEALREIVRVDHHVVGHFGSSLEGQN